MAFRMSLRLFIINFFVIAVLQYAVLSYVVGVLRTLEKRFSLSSTQMGVIQSSNDVVTTVLSVVIGYYGSRIHKPRLLFVLNICTGLGSILFITPVLLPNSQGGRTNMDNSSENTSEPEDVVFQNLCTTYPSRNRQSMICKNDFKESEKSSPDRVLMILVAASILVGIGKSGLHILSVVYIDQSTSREKSAFYIGIIQSAFPIGPILGLLLTGFALRLPENLKEVKNNENFIGCWWLGFAILGVLLLVSSFPLLLFPRSLVQDGRTIEGTDNTNSLNETEEESTENISTKERNLEDELSNRCTRSHSSPKRFAKHTGFKTSLCALLGNGCFMFLVVSGVCVMYVVPGIFAQAPRYLQTQFHIPGYMAGISAALSGALACAIGNAIAGFLMKFLKLSSLGSSRMYLGGLGILIILLIIMASLGCDQQSVMGLDYKSECERTCNCANGSFQPVCLTDDHMSYSTPCYAGCTTFNNSVYSGCGCSGVQRAEPGLCPVKCNRFTAYIAVYAVMSLLTSLVRIPGVILQLRLVDEDLKSFGMGITGFVTNLLVYVPGPILFGKIVDSTCLLWENLQCKEGGSCIVYDNRSYRLTMHGATTVFCVLALMFAFLMHIKIRNKFNDNQYCAQNVGNAMARTSSIVESSETTTTSDVGVTKF